MIKLATKYLLLTFPDSPIKVDGRCPKCGYPLKAKTLANKTFFVCKNPLCDYFSSIPQSFDINLEKESTNKQNNDLKSGGKR